MTARTLPLATLAAFLSLPAVAQTPAPDPHAAQPERPTVATHAGTVAAGWLEIESGTELDRYTDRSQGGFIPNEFKVGLAPRLQLNIQAPIVRPAGTSRIGIGDMFVGVKWRLAENAPILGDFAILPSIKAPSGSANSGTGTTDISLLFISSHKLGPAAMDLNFGYTRRSGDGTAAPRNATVWTAAFSGPARGRLGWTAEIFGFPSTSGQNGMPAIIAFLGGPTFDIREWIVVDAGIIAPITGNQPRAVYAGIVYNIGRLWK